MKKRSLVVEPRNWEQLKQGMPWPNFAELDAHNTPKLSNSRRVMIVGRRKSKGGLDIERPITEARTCAEAIVRL